MSKSKIKLKISYNAPVILTFCIFCILIFAVDKYLFPKLNIIQKIFTVPGSARIKSPDSTIVGFDFKSVIDYLKLFTHVLGHASWEHLLGNLSFILLIGPLLEERYGSKILLLMIFVTALVTGVLNACLIPTPLLGASGIAFMLIILSSFTSFSKNEIPLSFIFVFVIYLGSELFLKKADSNISVLAHVAGGLCGSLFGFLIAPKNSSSSKKSVKKNEKIFFKNRSKDFESKNIDEVEYLDEDSPRFKNENSFKNKNGWGKKSSNNNSSSDETIVGTIEL